MSTLQPPEKFSFKPEEWPQWIQEFKRFRSASELNQKSGETQRDTLLYVMGRESEKILQNLEFRVHTVGEGTDAREEQEVDTDFETLISKFDAYFIVKRNIIHERTQFQERKQKETETVEEFYRSLRSLVAHCQYTDIDGQLRDRFVVGLKDVRLKEKLQLTHDLTLSKAIEVARQHEQIKEQMKQQGFNASSDEAKDEFRSRPHRQNRDEDMTSTTRYTSYAGNRDERSRHSDQKNASSSSRGRGRFRQERDKRNFSECDRCGRQHGRESECPARGRICRKCMKKGHYANKCRSVQETVLTESEEEEFSLDSAEIEDDTEAWMVDLKIKGTDIKFKIDSGADITIMKEKSFEKMKVKPQLRHTNVHLTSPAGKLMTRGEFFAKISYKEKSYKFRVIVV
ncbi:hypothetical protein V1264_022419 [Littorina saxatilis]|uniref:CCHC-type domain-containing protein n=1 Tax=Littorina saxatilis TaxID=31220 RepID=A0AAN9AKC0_9CAEN